MQKYMKDKSDIVKDILISEELYSTWRVTEIPIDIENSMLGREMNTLIPIISGSETVAPYCDVSLRILMRIADILMFSHVYRAYDIVSGDDVVDDLFEFQKSIYKEKLKQEANYWIDIPNNFHQQILDETLSQELKVQHYNFT